MKSRTTNVISRKTRVHEGGGDCHCPHCGAVTRVYNAEWTSIRCWKCEAAVPQAEWIYKGNEAQKRDLVDQYFKEEVVRALSWRRYAKPWIGATARRRARANAVEAIGRAKRLAALLNEM